MQKLKTFILPLLWAAFILFLCGLPGKSLHRFEFPFPLPIDKLVHIFLFGMLALLLLRSINKLKTSAQSFKMILYTITICLSYGILIEILQEYWFSGRSAELYDVIADTAGALLGVLCYTRFSKNNFFSRFVL